MGSQFKDSFFIIVSFVDNVHLSAVISDSSKISITFFGDCQSSNENLSESLLIDSFLRSDIVVANSSVIASCDNLLIDAL